MEQFSLIKNILVPVPLNRDFHIPLKQALQFQGVYESKIILLTVTSDHNIFHKVLKPDRIRKNKKKAKRKLKKMVKSHFNGKIPENIELKVASGKLLQSILKAAREFESDLIIIKKAKRIQRKFNSLKTENADKLIAEAVCPVLTIFSESTPENIKNIMVPLEIFKPNGRKIEWAVSLASEFNSKLHLVSAVDKSTNPDKSLSFKQARKIENYIKRQKIEVEKNILKDPGKNPHQIILDHIDSVKPDMLIIMTRKESVVRENYLGRFAQEIIHNSNVPVLSIVPNPADNMLPYNAMNPVSAVRKKKEEIPNTNN